MRNQDIRVESSGRISFSREAYDELKAFCAHHGETDLPEFSVTLLGAGFAGASDGGIPFQHTASGSSIVGQPPPVQR